MQFSTPNDQLIHEIKRGDIDQVKAAILKGADANYNEPGELSEIPLSVAIDKAEYSLEHGLPDAYRRLQIIELLIQSGALTNNIGLFGWTPLEKALSPDMPKTPIIKLLLGYGVNITENDLKDAKGKPNSKELLKIFDIHQRLLQQIKSNSTKELLTVTILSNQPYFVQLIVDQKPELVTLSDIELAKETSPGSVPVLQKAYEINKVWQIASERDIPVEVAEYIEKFVERNK